jgi:hydroxymethylpyrimidine pyrophosphatase-like HAD family hydrolase
MNKSYLSAAFDVDGTLTEFGKWSIPKELLFALAEIPLHVPLVLCTGRPLKYIHKKIDLIVETSANPEAERKRWSVICENGGAAYSYNPKTKSYEMFFEAPWPDQKIPKETLAAAIQKSLSWYAEVVIRDYTVVLRFPSLFYIFPKLVKMESKRTHRKLEHFLKKEGWDELLQVQDSGIGNIILPKTNGKHLAAKAWMDHLGLPHSGMICIGDRPDPGGNDEDFLSGQFGSGFTVGELNARTNPTPVFDVDGKRLIGPRATMELIRRMHWT